MKFSALRALFLAFLSVFLALPAFAADGLTPDLISGGAGLDWLNGPGFTQRQVVPIQIEYGYAFNLNRRTEVITGHRILAAPGDESRPSAYVNEMSAILAYDVSRGFRVFLGGIGSMWGAGITGSPETLVGHTEGFAFPVDDTTYMVVGFRQAWKGGTAVEQRGFVFGPTFTL